MGHELYSEDQMFSVRERPWHFDETTSFVLQDYPGREDAMRIAGHDFTVVELPVFEQIGEDFLPVDGFKLLRNSKNGRTFTVNHDTYVALPNELGWDIADAMLDQDNVLYETAGTLKHGAICWVLAKIDEPSLIPGDDSPVFPYVAVVWGHDGRTAMTARATTVRVVCWNTLSMSEAEASRSGREFVFRHTKNVKDRIEDARDALRGARAEHLKWVEMAQELAELPVSDQGIVRFMTEFGPTAQPSGAVSDRVQNNIDAARGEFMAILNGGLTITEANRNSAYGLVQAGVEFLDHVRGFRSRESYCRRTILRDEALKGQLVPLARRMAEEDTITV